MYDEMDYEANEANKWISCFHHPTLVALSILCVKHKRRAFADAKATAADGVTNSNRFTIPAHAEDSIPENASPLYTNTAQRYQNNYRLSLAKPIHTPLYHPPPTMGH